MSKVIKPAFSSETEKIKGVRKDKGTKTYHFTDFPLMEFFTSV